jgi:peroxiredoxin
MFISCSSGKQDKAQESAQLKDELPHDPYSAPLHSASNKAEAADFETELLNGETFRLADQRGKVVLLNIWATWCPPCEEETPELVNLYSEYKGRGVEFLGISIDEQGPSVVKPFVKKYDVNYPMTVDDGTFQEKYGPMMGVPTTYLIDKKGDLRYFATGAITRKELEPRLEKLLKESNS